MAGGSNASNVRIKDGAGTPVQASIFNGQGPNIIETTLTPALNSDSAQAAAPTQVTDALLDPGGLKNNGGPTQTIALVAVKRVNKTSTTMLNSTLVTVNTGQMSLGMIVAGTGVPAGTTIAAINSGTQITLSAKATQTSSSTLADMLSGSPAIGKADVSLAPATDQRGFARGSTPDLGAFQAVFTDNFTRPNSTNLGSNWTTVLGTMGISGNKAAGLTTPGLPYVVDLTQVNGISLLNAADSALVNVGTTGERYAGVFARRDAAGDMYVAMLGVNSAANPAGTPTAVLLFRFTPNLPGTQSGGWSFLAYKLLPTPPNTGSANLGLDVTGTGLSTTLHLYLNGTLMLTYLESQPPQVYGVSQHPLNNPGGVGLLSVKAGTTYGTFIAGLPGSVPQAQELAGSPLSGLGVASLTAVELSPIVTAAEARWESAGLTAAQKAQLQGLQFLVTGLAPGMLGEHVPGVIYLDPTADGWGWFVDPTPGQDEEYASKAGALAALPGSGAAGHVDLLTVVMHEMGHALGLPDWTTGSSNDSMAESLAVGVRRLPSPADIDAVFTGQL